MLLGLLLTVNVLVCLALIGVVLLQKSEGGALGGGSGPTGLITTRGVGDLLTRTTWVLFTIFLSLSLALTLLGGHARSDQAAVERFKSLSINPDARRPPGAPGSSPARTPAQGPAEGPTAPAPVQLPPLSGTPGQARSGRQAAPAGPVSPSPLALPPLTPEAPTKPSGAP